MQLSIIRHTRLNLATGICYGQSEVETASSFNEEKNQLIEKLDQSFDRVIASPLSRCTRLAESLSPKILETDSRLLEYNFGDWELKKWDDLNQPDLQLWMDDFVNVAPPNGETLVEMMGRVSQFLDELRHTQDGHIVIVTHGGVIRCIYSYLLDIPLENLFKISIGYGDVHRCILGNAKIEDSVQAGKV